MILEDVVKALIKVVAKEVCISCAELRKCSEGSILYGNNYNSLKVFSFDKIWLKMKANFPFLSTVGSPDPVGVSESQEEYNDRPTDSSKYKSSAYGMSTLMGKEV